MHWIYHIVRHALVHWGYWAVLAGLVGENAGIPLPGETVLMFASFLAHKNTGLQLTFVILVGTAAAVTGDNLGFWIGRKLGNRLIRWMKKLFHMDDTDIGAAKDQMRRHGPATIFWARYIFGLRTVAGPLAGVLGMEWKKFLLYNALGASTWVTAMALVGYLFADQFDTLLGYFEKASWVLAAGLFALGYYIWHRKKKRFKKREEGQQAA
jgi:membrane-associated protein